MPMVYDARQIFKILRENTVYLKEYIFFLFPTFFYHFKCVFFVILLVGIVVLQCKLSRFLFSANMEIF